MISRWISPIRIGRTEATRQSEFRGQAAAVSGGFDKRARRISSQSRKRHQLPTTGKNHGLPD
jgi:hypothetical protein